MPITAISLSTCLLGVVFGTLYGMAQGMIPAGNQAHDQPGVYVEGGWALRRVQHAQAPGRTRTRIKQPSALFQAFGNAVDRLRNSWQLGMDCVGHGAIRGVDHFQHLQSRKLVDFRRIRMARLSQQVLKLHHQPTIANMGKNATLCPEERRIGYRLS